MRRTLVIAVALLTLLAPAAQAADPSYVRDPLTNRLHQRPSKINFRDVDITSLKWTHWGWTKAIAHGNANVLICEPSCADGRRVKGKVRVVVSKRVQDGNRRVYTCIKGTVSGVPKAYQRISFGC
jgi:hypothetical protein